MGWTRETIDGPFEIAELILGGILPVILIIIGTSGNLLCIGYLIRRKHKRSPSTYIYLIFLFLADTLSLYQWNLNYAVMILGDGKQLSDRSLFLCRSVEFLSFYTLHLSAIFLTLVSIDRTSFLWFRYYRSHLTKRYYALAVSIIVFLVLFAIDGFILSLGIVDIHTNKIQCYYTLNQDLLSFYKNIYPWIHLVIMYIVPFIIMIVGTILIIIKLLHRRTNPRHLNQNQRLSLMLVGMCIVYMILTLPNRLCFSVFLQDITGHIYTDTILLGSNTLLYTRNATNVFFLWISSARFRRKLVTCCCCCSQRCHNRVIPLQQIGLVTGSDHLRTSILH